MSSSENDQITPLALIPIYLDRYLGIVLYVIGNFGNLSSIAIFSKHSWRKHVCSFYFVICLLCSTVFVNSTLIGAFYIAAFNGYVQNYSPVLCKLFFYVSYLFSTYLPIVLILGSIDRLLISSQKVDTRLYSSKRLAYFSVATGFLVWSVFSLHVLIKVGIQQIYPTVFICYYNLSPLYLDFFSYSALAISAMIPLIMVVLSVVALKNVRRIRAVPRQQRKQVRSMTKKDFQLLRCLYLHNIVYVLCSILIVVSVVYSRVVKLQPYSPITQAMDGFLSNLGVFFHSIPYCCSFFIFVGMSKAFRQELKRGVYRLCGKDPTVVARGEDEINAGTRNAAVSTIDLRE